MTTKMIHATSTLVISTTLLIYLGVSVYATFANVRTAYEGHEVKITVKEDGFSPTNVVLRRGVQSRITFVRQVTDTCATEIVVRELGISLTLPLNEPASVDVTPRSIGQYDYGCGTGAFHGTITVR